MEMDAQQRDAADRFTAGLRPLFSRPLISSVGQQGNHDDDLYDHVRISFDAVVVDMMYQTMPSP